MELRFVDPNNQDFADLAAQLDAYYFQLVGEVHLRYAAYNLPQNFNRLAVVYENDTAIACGCWKTLDEETAEIKRIFVLPTHRRKGAATLILRTLEQDLIASGYQRIILETARTTSDSHALYLSLGYQEIQYYGSPAGAENCRCFEKKIVQKGSVSS